MGTFRYLRAAAVAFCAAWCVTSCDDYDDSSLREDAGSYGERLSALEEWQKKVDNNLAALQQLIAAQDYITGVSPAMDGNEEVGYEIEFLRSPSVIIYHGEKGETGDAGAAGATGDTGQPGPDGQDGDAFLQDAPELSDDGSSYLFTLLDGTRFSVAAYQSLRIGEGDGEAELALTESPQTVPLTLPSGYEASDYSALIAQITPEGSDGTYTHISSRSGNAGWSVEAELPESGAEAGVTVMSPATGGRALLRITLVRTDGSELKAARMLRKSAPDYVETEGGYVVYTAKGFLKWAEMAYAEERGSCDIDCTLGADIDLTGQEWMPICTYNTEGACYTGTFDGAGHAITGMAVNTEREKIESGVIRGMYIGGIIGCLGEGGTVKNVRVTNAVITSNAKEQGGIVGYNLGGTVSNCSFSGTMVNEIVSHMGGIAGLNEGGKVIACYSNAMLKGPSHKGGIVGYNMIYKDKAMEPVILACYSHASIENKNGYDDAGGIAGYTSDASTLAACYWSASGAEPVAGIGNVQNKEYDVNTNAAQVTGSDWASPMTEMNNALSTAGYSFKYEANAGEDKGTFPLVVVE